MRIGIAIYALEMGGVETFLQNLCAELKREGHEIRIVETESSGVWSDEFRELGYEVVTVPKSPLRTPFQHAARVGRALSACDALLLNDAPVAVAALGCLPSQTVAITVLHTDLPSMTQNATVNAGRWRRVVTVSPGLQETLLRGGHTDPERVVCIPNGVRVGMDSRVPTPESEPLRVAYVGRLEHGQKGVLNIPGIMAEAHRIGANLALDVIGDGPDRAALEQMLNAAPYPCRFHGRLPSSRAWNLLPTFDLLLMPSRYEGLPMALLEAMGAGVVPVVSRLPGSTDFVVKDGENGCLREPGDIHGFAETIGDLARNRAVLARMSRQARSTVQERFTTKRMAEAYLALIQQCLAESWETPRVRTRTVDGSLLGDFPHTPYSLVRPLRKTMRLLGLYEPAVSSQVNAAAK